MSKDQNFISAVAAVDSADRELFDFLSLIEKTISEHYAKGEMILVVSVNADQIRAAIREHFKEHPTQLLISIITVDTESSREMAMNAGRDLAIGDYVFEFDDIYVDYEPSVVLEAYEKCLSGYDIVTARDDRRSRMTSRLFYGLYNHVAGKGRSLGPSSFRVLSRRAINRVKSLGTYIPYRKAVYRNAGLNHAEVVYTSSSKGSTSRHTVREARSGLAVDTFIYFTRLMERVSLFICGAFFLITIAIIIYIVGSLIYDHDLSSGWASIMGFLSIGFTGLFGLMTIVIKYLSVVLDLVFRRQRYLVQDIEKITGA